ncbi:MAG: hypothetical protein Q9218_001575 [Villophora microphyllina]
MEQLRTAWADGVNFPLNLPNKNHLDYVMQSYFEQLEQHQHRLFSQEQDSALTFRELDSNGKGERVVAQDFYSDCFHQRTCLSNLTQGLTIPARAWSGYDFKVCYSLKSVERSETQTAWPWSIRHCAVHHTFDVLNIRSTWVIVKGNELIEKRITSATRPRSPPEFSSYDTIGRAFASALASHLLVIDWAGENWRWYINFLEEQFENMTKGAISIDADIPSQTLEVGEVSTLLSRTNTQLSRPSPKVGSFPLSPRLFSFSTQRTATTPAVNEMQPLPSQQYHTNPRSGKRQPLPPGKTIDTTQTPKQPTDHHDSYGQRQFKFRHIQDIQDLEESANEIVLVLRMNLNVCKHISEFYQSLLSSKQLPRDLLEENSHGDLANFQRRTQGVINQMDGRILRVEALLRLIADRKTLLYGLLKFQNTRSNMLMASESQKSTRKMEKMTHEMSEIARKTKTETVSMKIITLVTLFFLPGTFIATLMSTDIVHWSDGDKKFQPGALHIYLALCVPFMVATFLIWAGFQWREKRNEELQTNRARENLTQQ